MAAFDIVVIVARKNVASNGKNYAVVNPDNGGSFCIFPKKGHADADNTVKNLPVGQPVTLHNVGLYEGAVLVYDNTKVS